MPVARETWRGDGVEPASTLFSYAVEREQAEPLGIVYVQQDLSQFTVPTPGLMS